MNTKNDLFDTCIAAVSKCKEEGRHMKNVISETARFITLTVPATENDLFDACILASEKLNLSIHDACLLFKEVAKIKAERSLERVSSLRLKKIGSLDTKKKKVGA